MKNNIRNKLFYREKKQQKKTRFGFQKAFFTKGTSGKRGVVLYSGEYGK